MAHFTIKWKAKEWAIIDANTTYSRQEKEKKKVETLTNGKIFPFGRLPHIFNPIKKKKNENKITGLRFIKKNNFINKVAECVTTSTSSAQLRNYNIFIYDYDA
jgi:hypothetical protein